MADIICSNCKTEFHLHEFRSPFKDEGATLHCKCGKEIYSYPKGTYYYSIEECSVYRERMAKQEERKKWEEENYPKCECGLTMVKRKGTYGEFFGCSRYPKGCNITKKVPAKLKNK